MCFCCFYCIPNCRLYLQCPLGEGWSQRIFFFFSALSRHNPSLAEVATPMRDVGCFVGVEKPLQFFLVPLK